MSKSDDMAEPAGKAAVSSKSSKPDQDESAGKQAVRGPRMGGKIVNAPVVTNTGGYELKVVPAKPDKVAMAGQNTGGFELRAVQEQGTH